MLIHLINVSALAIDINEIGDFSSRSIIINSKRNNITQEQKDILTSKKLTPTAQCLIEQIKKQNIENVRILLMTGVSPNANLFDVIPIYVAAKKNNFEIVKLLSEAGAKLDRGPYSELYIAIKNNNKEMAQYLLNKNANIYYIDAVTQNTILYLALKNKMYDIAQQLINKNARADIKSIKYIKKHKLYYLIENKKRS